ncbi:hypothetical protein ES677_05180 [Bizionia gelidisalsuginis]|uniref:Type I restriction modification DNA specificity domain-containing protein n=1 Tax=Bizionia gelidisalsuginis TaxID=291188 RepID=A0ABY3MBS1_9FLAO|nr:restriction endonuclease subunit S [Bizionia gelidisalsuginis]TYC14774.1 hypothetical protein ES677_05180 [Bizionia gelidisalsuginis]
MSSVVDKIPKGWVEVSLGELVETNKNSIGQTYKHNEIYYLDTGSITEGVIVELKKHDLQDAPSRAKRLVQNKDIIYSTVRPNQKHYGFIENPLDNLVVSTGFTVITTNNDNCAKYIYYLLTLNSVTEYLHQLAEQSTSAYPSIKSIDLENLEITIPKELQEQKAIAKVLTAFDDKIENLRAQNQTLETLAQTIFKEWFGKYQIGDVLPEGWRVETLDNLLELIIDYRGKTPKKLGMDWSGEGIPALSAKTIKNGKIVRRDAMNFGSPELYKLWMKDELKKGDILLTSEAPLGEMYYINDDTKFILSQRLFALRVNEGISSEYLYDYLFSNYGQHLLNARASGSTVQGIRQSELRKIEVIVPEEKIMKKASRIFRSAIQKKAINAKQIQSLTKTRDTLLPKLMSGQLRVNEFKSNL